MAAIGFVNGTIEEGFAGQLRTLSIRAAIEIRPNRSKSGDIQPDFRVYSDQVEIGAGWIRVSEASGKTYVSLSLAAPEFGPRRIYANLGRWFPSRVAFVLRSRLSRGMRMYQITYDLEDNRPIIPVIIRYQTFDAEAPLGGPFPEMKVRALVDTGAMACVISPSVIAATGLKHVGEEWHKTLTAAPTTVPVHQGIVEFVYDGDVPIEVGGVKFLVQATPEEFEVILGMPVISSATWKFKPDGTFSVEFG